MKVVVALVAVLALAGVTVAASRLTVRLEDLSDNLVRDILGTPCAPVVVPAK